MDVMSTQGLLERPNGFYFQARIPKKYQSHYPSVVLRENLFTSNRKEAIGLVRKRWAELHEEFKRIDQTQSIYKTTISASETDYLIGLAIHSRLSADDEIRNLGVDDDTFTRLEGYAKEAEQSEKLVVSRGQLSPLAIEIASDWLQSYNYDLDTNSHEFRDFALKFIRAQITATKAIKLRQEGTPSETPPRPSLPTVTSTQANTLEDLRDYWLTQGKRSRATIAEASTIIRKAREFIGELKPHEWRKEHIVLLKDKMLEAGSSPATINKGRGILAAIFSCAEKNAKLAINPFKDMEKLKVPERIEDSPYTIAELQSIFNSPVFTQGYRPKRFPGDSAYWLPLLGLYTGGRLNELGQLYVNDIGTLEGINFIIITPDEETFRSVKDGKRRRLPLHPDLISLGFMDYVSKIKAQGHNQLFPELKIVRTQGKLADKWGEWWRRYVKTDLGLTRIKQPFHAFRHTFIEYSRNCNMSREARMRIVGHALNTVDDKHYGNNLFPLEPLFFEIKKLGFKGLDLNHLS